MPSALPPSPATASSSPFPTKTKASEPAQAGLRTLSPGQDFDIDARSGFLPFETPLERFPDELQEGAWDRLLADAKAVQLKINGGGADVDEAERRRCRQWRRRVRQMAVLLPSEKLRTDVRYARRGHVALSFLAHFYLHSQPQPQPARRSHASPSIATQEDLDDAQDAAAEAEGRYIARLPASLSAPLLLLSSQLDIPPVLTYADTVLWNWRLKDETLGLVAGNVEIVETFSSTKSEAHFFLTSLLIELRGVAALDLMRACLEKCYSGNALAEQRVTMHLTALRDVIVALGQILHDVRTDCDPATFYWGIRPWFRGGDSSPHETKGWCYPSSADEGKDNAKGLTPRLFTGPSAGQSSMIHALDVFLDVDHAGIKTRATRAPLKAVKMDGLHGARVTADATSLPPDATFMKRMQLYMPGPHRRFLTYLQNLPIGDDDAEVALPTAGPSPTPLRYLAMRTLAKSPEAALPRAYDEAVRALRSLRDEHMRIATLYIVTQARAKPPREYAALTAEFVGKTLVDTRDESRPTKGELAEEKKADGQEDEEGPKGTGGTSLVRFLKDCRKHTIETLLSEQSQR